MANSTVTPKKEIEKLFESAGLRYFALVDPVKAFSESNEIWKSRRNAFKLWIDENKHGSMTYLEQNNEVRLNPNKLFTGTKSALVFLIPYSTGRRVRRNAKHFNPIISAKTDFIEEEISDDSHCENSNYKETNNKHFSFIDSVAKYARHKDYHKAIKSKLTIFLKELSAKLKLNFEFKIAVDSVPFLDRAHAELAGLGFIGKNTMLIRPGLGSYFFIASVFLDLDLSLLSEAPYDTLSNSISRISCNDCLKCVEACPTQALDGQYRIDARKCFSYWSIESRTTPPDSIKPAFKNLFFGCDICQDVCPYNAVTIDGRSFPEFLHEAETLHSLTLEQIAVMTKIDYENWFGGLPMTRAKYSGLVRNALYALHANAKQDSLQKAMAFWNAKQQELKASGRLDSSYALISDTLQDLLLHSTTLCDFPKL